MYHTYGSYQVPQQNKYGILKDRFYVPAEFVLATHLEAYEHLLEIGKDPLTEDPITQKFSFYEVINGGEGKLFYAFARGDLAKLRRVFFDLVIHDQRVEVEMKNPLRIKFPKGMSYRPYQFPAIEAFQSAESGLLKALTYRDWETK